MSKEEKYIPIQYIPIHPQEDEIDLKEIIKTLIRYKKFILIFTFTITILAGIYAFLKKPIYETKTSLQIGYLLNYSDFNKIYFLDPIATKIYIKNTYPAVEISNPERIKDIYNLKILGFSNKDNVKYINKILKDLKNKESKKVLLFKKNIEKKIKIIKEENIRLTKELNNFNQKLSFTKDPKLYAIILNNISEIQNKITQNKLKIVNLENQLSPSNITYTHIIGNIKQSLSPVKPKKKLIIIVAFITSFILSLFLVFLIEFIKNLKESE